jgi:hypothetical protein
MRECLYAAFIYLLDWVYMYCMDMDLISPGSKDKWDEWDHLISAKWSGLSDKPKLQRHSVDIRKWPTYCITGEFDP